MNINMFPHVGSGNHGVEAIYRATRELFPNEEITLFSDNEAEDRKYIPDISVKIKKPTREISRFSAAYFRAIFRRRFLREANAFTTVTLEPLLNACKKNSVLLSTGGDLYCYEKPEYIYRVNRYVRKNGCKTVLWGCSVEPSYIDEEMAEDLRGYSLICARESISYEALKTINSNTILVADPAFILPMQKTVLPATTYVGINVSPMIAKREQIPGITIENYIKLITYILENRTESVALIPHVVWSTNDDRTVLRQIKNAFPDNNRVIMVDDHNCVQQKYIISHCKFFVGARTHATIAAYSTCVPTLVVGYSVKAKGIAKDLFGEIEHYVLPVQSLEKSDDLTRAFQWVEEHEDSIRKHLNYIMPEYKQRAVASAKAVFQLGDSI